MTPAEEARFIVLWSQGVEQAAIAQALGIPRGTCWRYIDAIEAELVAWGIVLPVNDEAQ